MSDCGGPPILAYVPCQLAEYLHFLRNSACAGQLWDVQKPPATWLHIVKQEHEQSMESSRLQSTQISLESEPLFA